MKRRKNSQDKALTFIELSLVSVLIAVICFTIYASLAAGMKVWEKSKEDNPELYAYVFFDKISHDLKNCFKFSRIPPQGKKDTLSFAVFQGFNASSEGNLTGFGMVEYNFDYNGGKVSRTFLDFKDIVSANKCGQPRALLDNIKSCSFKYYYFDNESKEGVWKDAIEGEIPSAVEVDMSFISNNKLISLSKIITLYAGS